MDSNAQHYDSSCAFCEQPIDGSAVVNRRDRLFCCAGCATAHDMLSGDSGYGPAPELLSKYEHLVVATAAEGFQRYSSTAALWEVSLPAIHCTSCLILLERMPEWLEGVTDVRVSFSAKRATVHFNPELVSISVVAAWLDFVGYPPSLITAKRQHSSEVMKLGIAGFAMGNAMMSAFPEYFGLDAQGHSELLILFRYSTAFFATVSLIIAGRFYLESAWKAIRGRTWSLDIPIAIGMTALWGWSSVLLVQGTSGGYFDSLSGLIFFLLLGKFLQRRTYAAFSFERTVNDFLPLSVFCVNRGQFVRLGDLQEGDTIELAKGGIVPAEVHALSDVEIDYSFITGESQLVAVKAGDTLMVGGKILSEGLRATVAKKAQSTSVEQLWKDDAPDTGWVSSKMTAWFTLTVIALAIVGGLVWWDIDPTRAIEISVSVLIIACPCALSLAAPFAYGTAAGVLSKYGIFLKSGRGVEELAKTKHIAWDKTGTLTGQNIAGDLELHRREWSGELASIVARSAHPIAVGIRRALDAEILPEAITQWREVSGEGIHARDIHGRTWFVGSGAGCGRPAGPTYAVCDGTLVALYRPSAAYRTELTLVFRELENLGITHHLVSGDAPRELPQEWHASFADRIHFERSPEQKAQLITPLENCLFIGDGLNDIDAMKSAAIGLAVVEGKLGYFPKSDGILFADQLHQFTHVLRYSKRMVATVKAAYILSLIYNITGVVLALLGHLSPVIAAVLMPLSSISVVLFVVLFAWGFAPKD